MRILAIGDTHGQIPKNLPRKDIDLILLTGDIGKSNIVRKISFDKLKREKEGLPPKEYSSQFKKKGYLEIHDWAIKTLKYLIKIAPVYLVYGNIETFNKDNREVERWAGQKVPPLTRDILRIGNVRIINNRFVNLNGIKIGGLELFIDSGWLRKFEPYRIKERGKKSRKATAKARKVLRRFGRYDLDILLCHQPPYGILDKVSFPGAPKHWIGKHAGSKVILDYIKEYHPRYVICGHIHESAGRKKVGKTEVINLGMGRYKVIVI